MLIQLYLENFTLEEQAEILKADRSNNCLDTDTKFISGSANIKESVKRVLKKMKTNKNEVIVMFVKIDNYINRS